MYMYLYMRHLAEAAIAEQFSIADARSRFPQLIHRAEKGRPVAITRRGKPVAMIVSAADYERLTKERPSLWATIVAFRRKYDVDRTGLDSRELRDLRDRAPGRKFKW